MRKKLLDSLFSVVALFSLLVNSLSAPLSVYAQEVTPEPTPIVEETPTPTPTEEPTITPEVTPTPTEAADGRSNAYPNGGSYADPHPNRNANYADR